MKDYGLVLAKGRASPEERKSQVCNQKKTLCEDKSSSSPCQVPTGHHVASSTRTYFRKDDSTRSPTLPTETECTLGMDHGDLMIGTSYAYTSRKNRRAEARAVVEGVADALKVCRTATKCHPLS